MKALIFEENYITQRAFCLIVKENYPFISVMGKFGIVLEYCFANPDISKYTGTFWSVVPIYSHQQVIANIGPNAHY